MPSPERGLTQTRRVEISNRRLIEAAAALIAEKGWEDLDGPVVRVATPDVPIPFSPPLEQAVLPSVDRVKEAARELLEY